MINTLSDHIISSGGKRLRPIVLMLSAYASDPKVQDKVIVVFQTGYFVQIRGEARERARAERLASEQEGTVTFQPPVKDCHFADVGMQSRSKLRFAAVLWGCGTAQDLL